jgi:hypothetical protein
LPLEGGFAGSTAESSLAQDKTQAEISNSTTVFFISMYNLYVLYTMEKKQCQEYTVVLLPRALAISPEKR